VVIGLVLLALSAGPQQSAEVGVTARVALLGAVLGAGALAAAAMRVTPPSRSGLLLGVLAGLCFGALAVGARIARNLAPAELVTDPAAWAAVLGGVLGLALGAVALQRAGVVGVTAAMVATEALVGAGIVLLRLVADNDSLARAVYLGVHLVNTFLLLAAMSLTAWWGSGQPAPILPLDRRRIAPLLGVLGGLLLVGITGAITALGDTLFPAGSLAEGMRQDASPTAHILLRLRVFHPVLALTVGTVLLALAVRVTLRDASPATSRVGRLAAGLVLAQVALGVLNLLLLAPIWMQLVHLFMADLVWLGAVLLTAAAAAEASPIASGRQSPALDTAIAHR